MTVSFRPWLPDGALEDGVLCARVQAIAASWADRWMPLPNVHTNQVGDAGQTGQSAHERIVGNGKVQVATGLACRLHLGMAMLGVTVDRNQVAEDDQVLLERLADTALENLVEVIAAKLADIGQQESEKGQNAAELEANAPVHFRIVLADAGPAVDLALAFDLAIAARKAGGQPSRTAEPVNWRNAVGAKRVRVGARVGAASLPLGEVSSLECGDVIVLDRRVGDSVDLTIDGQAVPGSTCQIEQDRTQTSLRFGA